MSSKLIAGDSDFFADLVWARQRSSIYAHDCLIGFLISVIVAYLATESSRNRINNSMNAMQIFRVTLDFIATSKVWERVLLFWPQGVQTTSKELRDEAAFTLGCIMTKIDFAAKYDYCIRLNLKGNSEVYAFGFCLDDECWGLYEQKVHFRMHQGLGDRAKFVCVTWSNTISDCNIEDGPTMFDREALLIGISDSSVENAQRMIDIGRPENKEVLYYALKFRKFWGDKAELRRFTDGRIAENAYCGCKEMERERWKTHLIIKSITEHVLLRHLSLSIGNVMHIADQLDFCLLHGAGDFSDPISFSGSLLGAFEILSKHLRLLNYIPLGVSSVQPLHPGSRLLAYQPLYASPLLASEGRMLLSRHPHPLHEMFLNLAAQSPSTFYPLPIFTAFGFTSVSPPEPHPLAYEKGVDLRLQKLTSTCIQPLEVMIQLEGSGNWPMDEVAIEKTKSAFLLKIGESLQNGWGMTCNASEYDVDVFVSGYAFRLLHERGLSLLKKQIASNQVKRVYSTDRNLFVRGQHSSMINGLQGCYPIYGPVVRITKRWVAAHLFSTSLVEAAIELLVAYLFLKPLPFYAPCSRITGFLRFLRLLSEYDWTYSALNIDTNADLTPNDEKEINDNFLSSRKAYQENTQNLNPAMFLATAYDKASEAWTRSSPNSSKQFNFNLKKPLMADTSNHAGFLNPWLLQFQKMGLELICPLCFWNQLQRVS